MTSENGASDSDSVNLGSNPSPPASHFIEKSGISAAGNAGMPGTDSEPRRTGVGTVRLSSSVCRKILAEKRRLRRMSRNRSDAVRECAWVARKTLTRMQADPLRPELAEYAAMAVRRAEAQS